MHADTCAYELLDVIPHVMRVIRLNFRVQKKDLSVPQFRALAFISFFPRSSLSQVSEHLGLTLPSTSKTVDVLVSRGLVTREPSPTDRRRVRLSVTPSGKVLYDTAMVITRNHLAERLSTLPTQDLEAISAAMKVLKKAFAAETDSES